MNETGIPRNEITGVILAGGRGSRMGGADKGWVMVQGQPMIEHVAARLRPQVGALVINANRNTERYAALGYPVVPDLFEGYLGPLAGMLSGMQAAATAYVVTAPCDSPLIGRDLVARLATTLNREDADIAVAHDGERSHPVFLLLRRDLADDLTTYLESGGRKIDRWFARHRVAYADFHDTPEAFMNVNDPGERAQLEERFAQAAGPC
jgi:molybdopterin-guanine dinucleotide biosynthesis protein A